ncbi:MAG: putative AAA+ family ATPase [Harvfovirus sp.]|uniref:Putative AAA+ family ATPase n=1 Tax=Harvfovirus sp. TaxID=2487768 RepID=A0A3G5A6V9_9VIRU|nr:MAG: putative AAA+ family ATPase [Harvfovirus sp.]
MDPSYYVLPSIINNIKTGNNVTDVILTVSAVISLIIFNKVSAIFIDKCIKLIKSIKFRNIKSKYIIGIKVKPENGYNNHTIPIEYLAILHHMRSKNIDFNTVRRIPEVRATSCGKSYVSKEIGDKNTNYCLESTEKLKINEKIFLSINKIGDAIDLIQYEVILHSYKYTCQELNDELKNWLTEYKKYLEAEANKQLYHFTYNGRDKDDPDSPNMRQYPFLTNKNFDNVFFEEKQLLKARIDYFLKNRDHYNKLGIQYALGLMFYGKPGCGKSSTIKAIANYTGRHVVDIPLSKIKTCDELREIFHLGEYNNVKIQFDNKIIVFEDIDCMSDIVGTRATDEKDERPQPEDNGPQEEVNEVCDEKSYSVKVTRDDWQKGVKVLDRATINKICSKYATSADPLTLAFLLNLIDGTLEQPGRILIFTTNYPEKIDDALIRPGRIDLKIDFKKCSNMMIRDIVEYYFGEKLGSTVAFPDYIFAPAEIFQYCMNSSGIKEAVNKILR